MRIQIKTKHIIQHVLIIYILICASTAATTATAGLVDKSGVKPNVLSLPSGPGSIQGLGESFEPQLNSGTASYSVPLALPQGRAGFAPKLSLIYNGGNGNSPFGVGWKISTGSIQRKTDKGVPVYDDAKDTFTAPNGEELIRFETSSDATTDHYYRCKNESEFDRFQRDGDAWKVFHKNGAISWHGQEASARIQDRIGPKTNIFKWSVSRQQDPNGNRILYKYNERDGFLDHDASSDSQTYLTSIKYNFDSDSASTPSMQVKLKYETRPEHDRVFDYRSRFAVQTSRRCKEIIIYAAGQRVRSYTLTYDAGSILSRLASVTMYGKTPTNRFPDVLSFTYSQFLFDPSSSPSPTISVTPMTNGPGTGLASSDVDLVDMNGDSLPDLLYTGDVHQVFVNRDGLAWQSPYDVEHGFTEIKLSRANTMLMDMNGDGASDLFSQDRSINGYRYFAGGTTGGGWNPVPVEMQNAPDFTFDRITKPVDLNRDGQTDVLRKTDLSDIACVFNLKGQSFSSIFTIDSPSRLSVFNFGGGKLNLADMNGDGLQDFVVLNQEGSIWYYPAKGVTIDASTDSQYQGWDNATRGAWVGETGEGYLMGNAPSQSDEPDFSETSKFRSARILDINADGMSDIVYVANNRMKAWLNMGGHQFSETISIGPGIPGLKSETYIRTADMNGNGSTDIVWNNQAGFTDIPHPDATWVYFDFTGNKRPNLLERIQNSTGRKTEIRYTSSTKQRIADRNNGIEWTWPIPVPVQVIDSIIVTDGQGHDYKKEISYKNGYYDGIEKEFRGFARSIQIEKGDASADSPAGISIPDLTGIYDFDVGRTSKALKGKPLSFEARDINGNLFYKENYQWGVKTLLTNQNAKEVAYAFQHTKNRFVYEKTNSPVNLKWEYKYDDYGNRTELIEHGRLDSGWDDERITKTEYTAHYASGISRWILDKVTKHAVFDAVLGAGGSLSAGAIASQTRHYYDGSNTLGDVSRGNLTKADALVSTGLHVTSQRNDYDGYGNIIKTYDPLYANSNSGHFREFAYDSVFHTFPVTERIHTGTLALTLSAEYDAGFGVVTSSTDFNGHATHYGYDDFGRLVWITKPPDSGHTLEYEYQLGQAVPGGGDKIINWVETRQRDTNAGSFLRSRIFYDGLGRKIMTRTEGENSNQVVVTDTITFNGRKLPWKKYLPYFEPGNLAFQAPVFSENFAEYRYDATGREVKKILPDQSFSAISYSPLARTARDEEQTKTGSPYYGCGKKYVYDGLLDKDGNGRLRDVYEIVKTDGNGEPLTSAPLQVKTSYSHNLSDKLAGYIDSHGNRKTIRYDLLGRKTFENDPDRGITHYQYDAAGNLVQKTDAKNQTIRYVYDGANRLLGEFYGKETTEPPDVEYHYDTPFGPLDKGDLWQGSVIGAQTIADHILWERRKSEHDLNSDSVVDVADVVFAKIRNTAAQTETSSAMATHTLGFLSWAKDQSGQEHHSYDERGRVKWIIKRIAQSSAERPRNFYTRFNYDSMDRMTRLTYPDSGYAQFNYNSRGLLESVPGIIDGYDYNPSGQNLLLQLSCGVSTRYTYDQRLRLDRLTTTRAATGPLNRLDLQDIDYTYDSVSNITGITDMRGAPVVSALAAEIGYSDATKLSATQTFNYDSFYRLTQASNAASFGTIHYRYDHIGNMISKTAALTTPDPLMNIGQMTIGASSGTRGRIGRGAADDPGPHAITTAQGLAFDYDANGNMISENQNGNQTVFAWNHNDRLNQITKGQVTASYIYDYAGDRKIKMVVDGADSSSTESVYINKYCEIRNNALVKYLYAGTSRIARAAQTATADTRIASDAFYLQDHLGSSSMTVLPNGTASQYIAYYPYGYERLNHQSGAAGPSALYNFTGKEKDAETGLNYFEARYYSSVIGRFNRVDPLAMNMPDEWMGDPQQLNFYGYCRGNPVKYVDHDGRKIVLDKDSSDKFKAQYNQAITYLKEGGASDVITELEKHPQTVYIKEAPKESNQMSYHPYTDTITWDPLSALKTTDDGTQTPALGLLHEAAHALGDLNGTMGSAKTIPGDPYHNAEEKRVITKYETPAAVKLGEGTRENHSAKEVYQVKSPNRR